MKSKKAVTLDSLKSKTLWHVRRTESIFTDEKSLYRSLVECWGPSGGLVCGDPIDMELEMAIDKILDKVDWADMERIIVEIDGEFEPEDDEDKDERDFRYMLYRELYDYIADLSEHAYTDREG